jgi:hypothetical protein
VLVSDLHPDDEYRAYREAVRRRVCAICLDGADDGACGLVGPRLRDRRAPAPPRGCDPGRAQPARRRYAAAVEAKVCSHCTHRDGLGLCRLRRDGRCTVSVYLPLVVEAVEEVERRHEIGPA